MIRSRPTFAQAGNRFVYAAGQQLLALKVYRNGKPSPVHRNVWGFALSPDGERCAYLGGVDASTTELIVDGNVVTRDGGFGGKAFSVPTRSTSRRRRAGRMAARFTRTGRFCPRRACRAWPSNIRRTAST